MLADKNIKQQQVSPEEPKQMTDAADIENNKVMAALSYFSVLVFIPIFAAPKSKFARFHANQGLVLLIAEVIFSVLHYILKMVVYAISWRLSFLTTIVSFAEIFLLVFSILGMVNAVTGQEKKIPIFGNITILKQK